jgi:hypothetical protein
MMLHHVRRRLLEKYVEEGQEKTHLNDMSGKKPEEKCAEEKGVRQFILMWFIQVSGWFNN